MSPKAKLTLVLCATTAIFTFNPNFVASLLHVDDRLAAEELTLDPSAVDGLKALTSTANTTAVDSTLSNNGGALAPRDFSGLSPNDAQPAAAETKDVAPGENPFSTNGQTTSIVNQQLNNAADPSLSPVANPGLKPAAVPGALEIKGAQQKTPTDAVANPFEPANQQKAALPTDAAKAKAKVDDSALRYYAAAKDLKRLGAEMRRLKTLYPDWQPPKDLFSPVANVSEQPLWEIYKTGNYSAVRAKIAQMQSTNPRWQPSDDLLYKLQLGETRSMIYRAYAQKRWNAVISVAQSYPAILVCSDMQVLWNVGESFAQTRNYAQSFDVYKYILTNCDDPSLRLSTVQKASLLLPSKGVSSLIALGKVMPDGTQEFENIGFDGVRRQIGEFIQQPGDLATAPSDEDLKRFVDFIQRTNSVDDAELMGWFFYTQQDWKLSNSWFIQASQYQRTPKSIEGVILTLRNMERPDDALKIARRYLKASPEVAQQYIEIISESFTSKTPTVTLKDKELDDFEKIVTDNKSPLGAQAIGWKYLNGGDKDKAKDWFTQSVDWKPTEGGVVGLAVVASRDKNYKVLTALKNEYRKDYASLDDFKIYTAKKASYKVKKYKRTGYRDAENLAPKKKKSWQFQAPG